MLNTRTCDFCQRKDLEKTKGDDSQFISNDLLSYMDFVSISKVYLNILHITNYFFIPVVLNSKTLDFICS